MADDKQTFNFALEGDELKKFNLIKEEQEKKFGKMSNTQIFRHIIIEYGLETDISLSA